MKRQHFDRDFVIVKNGSLLDQGLDRGGLKVPFSFKQVSA